MSEPTGSLRGRAFGPGLRRARTLVAVAAVTIICATGCGHHAASYGKLPSWLPESTVPVGRVVEASVGHPKLGIEGDTVSVVLPSSRMMATLVGPAVPEEGEFPQPLTVQCTFTVTLDHVSGQAVPLAARDFTVFDELGTRIPVTLTSPAGPAPAAAPAGQRTTFDLVAMVPPGAGTVQWDPGTAEPVVAWDFTVEVD